MGLIPFFASPFFASNIAESHSFAKNNILINM